MTECIQIVNRLIEKTNLSTPRICEVSEINPELILILFTSLFKINIPGLVSSPKSLKEHGHNMQLLIDLLSVDVIKTSLSHITGDDIARGELNACRDFLKVLDGCAKFQLEPVYDPDQFMSDEIIPKCSFSIDHTLGKNSLNHQSSLSSIPPLHPNVCLKESKTIPNSCDFAHIGLRNPIAKSKEDECDASGHTPRTEYVKGTFTHHLYHHLPRCKSQNLQNLYQQDLNGLIHENNQIASEVKPLNQTKNNSRLKTRGKAVRMVSTPVRKYPGKQAKSKSSQRRPNVNRPCVRKSAVDKSHHHHHHQMPILDPCFAIPALRPSTAEIERLKVPQQKYISSVVKASCKLPSRKSKLDLQLEEALRKQQLQSKILRKEIGHVRRMNELKSKANEQRRIKSHLRDDKIEFAKVKKYGNEFKSRLKSHVNNQKHAEYKILKGMFDEHLQNVKDAALKINKSKRNAEKHLLNKQKERIEEIESFNRNYFDSVIQSTREGNTDSESKTAEAKNLKEVEQEYKQRVEDEIEIWRAKSRDAIAFPSHSKAAVFFKK